MGRLWQAAAIPLNHIDAELAALCDQKSEAWISPDFWPKDKIDENGIRLGDLKEKSRVANKITSECWAQKSESFGINKKG